MPQYVIVTDSRGRGLDHHLSGSKEFKVVVRPGGTIQELASIAVKHVDEETELVFLWGGICNLTRKIHHEGGTQVVYDRTPQAAISAVEIARNLFKKQHNHIKLMFGTIPPVSLAKSATHYASQGKLFTNLLSADQITCQQKSLEQDIQIVKEFICDINDLEVFPQSISIGTS